MTRYFIVKYGDIQTHSSKLGSSSYFPVDPNHTGSFLASDWMFLAQDGIHQELFSGDPAFVNLPDPLRAGVLKPEILSRLPSAFNLTSQSTMFDLIDKLTEKSKDFQLKI